MPAPKKHQLPKTGLYCITASEYSRGRSNEEVVRQMLDAGVKIVQYREKTFSMRQKYNECCLIREFCTQCGAVFIVNNDVALALAVGADGVHVGQDDLPVNKVREIIGENMILGLSVTTPQQVDEAMNYSAVDYLGVGPIYSTATKKDAGDAIGLSCIDYIVEHYQIPVVAIGGIKHDNVAQVIEHGATCAAIITDIVSAQNIAQQIKELQIAISEARVPGHFS